VTGQKLDRHGSAGWFLASVPEGNEPLERGSPVVIIRSYRLEPRKRSKIGRHPLERDGAGGEVAECKRIGVRKTGNPAGERTADTKLRK